MTQEPNTRFQTIILGICATLAFIWIGIAMPSDFAGRIVRSGLRYLGPPEASRRPQRPTEVRTAVNTPNVLTDGRQIPGEDPETNFQTPHGGSLKTDQELTNDAFATRNSEDAHVANVQIGPYTIYMYSAFWDDRWELESDPVIRVLVIIRTEEAFEWSTFESYMQCKMVCPESRTWFFGNLEDHRFISGRNNLGSEQRQKYVLTCAAVGCVRPQRLTLTASNNARSDWRPSKLKSLSNDSGIPIEEMRRPGPKLDLITCKATVYGHIDHNEIVEWLELQKILGVRKVVVYNDSVDAVGSKVFRHYEEQGFVDLWQMDCIEHDEAAAMIWKSLAVTDCFYRYMYNAERIMIVDSDEIIVPKLTETLPELIRELDKNARLHNGTNLRVNYMFPGAVFPQSQVDVHPDLTEPPFSTYLRYRERFPHDPTYSKSIINPRGCVTAYNHHCMSKLPYYNHNKSTDSEPVSPDIASDHHYRHRLRGGTMRRFLGMDLLLDDTMLRYADRLVPNVKEQLQLLGL